MRRTQRRRHPRPRPPLSHDNRRALNTRPLHFEHLEPRRLLAAGDLDPTFGVGGKVTTEFFKGAHIEAVAAIATTSDNKIVAVGSGVVGRISRYNADGSLDYSFGNQGRASFTSSANDVAVTEDGKIVVVGWSLDDFAVARYNQDGTLDTSFDGDGRTTTDFSTFLDKAVGVVLQSDGKIIVAGRTFNGTTTVFAVARYNVDGSLDNSFGVDGKVSTGFGSQEYLPSSVILQDDGKIVVAGTMKDGTVFDFAIVRYDPNGALDGTFGSGGRVLTDLGGSESGTSVIVQNDGKLVVVGTSRIGAYEKAAIARYNPDGTPDTSFGIGGQLTTDYSIPFQHHVIGGVAIQDNGKLVVAGGNDVARFNADGSFDSSFASDGSLTFSFQTSSAVALANDGRILVAGRANDDFALARFTPDGILDNSFDGDGKLTTNFSTSGEGANSVAVQSDGKIVVAGSVSINGSNDYAVARYHPNGSLDTSFNGIGYVNTDFGISPGSFSGDGANSLIVQNDGKIIVVGTSSLSDGRIGVARYQTNGTLDTTFDGDGRVITDFGSTPEYGLGVALDSNGRIVVVGQSGSGTDYYFVLLRYNTNGTLDPTFDGDGKVTTNFGPSFDRSYCLAIQSDGKIVIAGDSRIGSSTNLALARYNSDGTLDASFDLDGMVTTNLGTAHGHINSIAIQPDGKLVVTGYYLLGSSKDILLARYSADGSLDASFDGDGLAITPIGSGSDEGNSVALQNDGKIVVAGSSRGRINNYSDFSAARYNADGSLDVTFGIGGKVIMSFNTWDDTAYGMAIQPDGKVLVVGEIFNGADYDIGLIRYEADPVPPLVIGDYNYGSTVDAADYVLWRKTLGNNVAVNSGADGDGDGVVDQDDYGVWRANFGNTSPASASATATAVAALDEADPATPATANLPAVPRSTSEPIRTTSAAMIAPASPATKPRHAAASRPPQRNAFDTQHVRDQALTACWLATTAGYLSPTSTPGSSTRHQPARHASDAHRDDTPPESPLDQAFATLHAGL